MSLAQELVERIDSIGTIPTAVAQVFALINDPKATMADFERVVRPDPGLTANLLRSANSAYYRATREITSVKDAIGRMGLRRVFEVAASASFAKTIPAELIGYGLSADAYWSHSVAVAVLADRIGREAGFTYPDLAFTAGLLHDLGKVVVSAWLESNRALDVSGGLTTLEREEAVLGTTHPELGEALCVRWHLPKDIVAAARWHHAPGDAPTATQRYLATVVQVADHAASSAGLHDGFSPGDVAEALERLGLDADKLAGIVARAQPEIERTRELLASTTRARAA
ncbi:MAG: HDOD domain-containing protein [Myxococcota bacterium]